MGSRKNWNQSRRTVKGESWDDTWAASLEGEQSTGEGSQRTPAGKKKKNKKETP